MRYACTDRVGCCDPVICKCFMFVWTKTDSEEHDSLPRSYFKGGVVLLHFQLVQIQKYNSCFPRHDFITVRSGNSATAEFCSTTHPCFLWKCVRRSSESRQEALKSFIARSSYNQSFDKRRTTNKQRNNSWIISGQWQEQSLCRISGQVHVNTYASVWTCVFGLHFLTLRNEKCQCADEDLNLVSGGCASQIQRTNFTVNHKYDDEWSISSLFSDILFVTSLSLDLDFTLFVPRGKFGFTGCTGTQKTLCYYGYSLLTPVTPVVLGAPCQWIV